MKKLIIVLLAVFALGSAALAQGNSEKYAIGLRLGGGYGWGIGVMDNFNANVEVSAMLGVGPKLNRIELDLGWRHWHFDCLGLYATYQWRWNIVKGLHWYVGPGAGVNFWFNAYNPVSLSIGGQVGLEYNFDFPLQLSLDIRPMIGIIDPWDNSNLWPDMSAAFGIRYRF